MVVEKTTPSLVHHWLQHLQETQKNIQHIFTQNIDGLEDGIDCPITHLHGILSSGHCLQCKYGMKPHLINRKQVTPERLVQSYTTGTVCHCEHCEGVIKPDILFYNEQVSGNVLSSFQQEAKAADLLLILGTSLSTYPVSNCLSFFQDCDIVGWK